MKRIISFLFIGLLIGCSPREGNRFTSAVIIRPTGRVVIREMKKPKCVKKRERIDKKIKRDHRKKNRGGTYLWR